MSTTIEPVDQFDPSPFPVRKWTLEEYHLLIAQGIFEDERVELLDGWIVPKMTKNPRHESTVFRVASVLGKIISSSVSIRQQSAVSFTHSEPEPDLSIVHGDGASYEDRHPEAKDLLLVIEVADTSLRRDRRKSAVYAAAGVPAYWIVNLEQHQIEVHQRPDSAQREYLETKMYRRGEAIEFALAETSGAIPVESLLPPLK